MRMNAPANWRQMVRTRQNSRKRTARLSVSRLLQMLMLVGLLLLGVAAAVVTDAPIAEVGSFDNWPFWLEQSGSVRQALGSALTDDRGWIHLTLINRPSAEHVLVTIDGNRVDSFSGSRVELTVREGDTVAVVVPEGEDPIRVRITAVNRVVTPALGAEWPVVSGEVILGIVTLSPE